MCGCVHAASVWGKSSFHYFPALFVTIICTWFTTFCIILSTDAEAAAAAAVVTATAAATTEQLATAIAIAGWHA